jgi:hypothetical protein
VDERVMGRETMNKTRTKGMKESSKILQGQLNHINHGIHDIVVLKFENG